MNQFNFNKDRGIQFSDTLGGFWNVYGGKADITLPCGYNIDPVDLINAGNVIPAGTPFALSDEEKVAIPHYAFLVHSPVGASETTVQVFKSGIGMCNKQGSRAKVGMNLIFLPKTATIESVAMGVKVVSVDASNENFDILTLSAAVGALEQGDILIEADKEGDGAVIKVLPTATSYADIPVYGDTLTQLVDMVVWCDVIYTRRIPPIHPAVREYMYAHGYGVYFYGGK
jgi:hypothetical protein